MTIQEQLYKIIEDTADDFKSLIDDKDAEIEELKEQVSDLEKEIEELKN